MNSTTKSGQLESLNEEESLYDDDQFESISMSKSMVGIGGGLTGAKSALVTKLGDQKKPKPQIQKKASVSAVSDDYSNEDFDSMSGISKSMSIKPRVGEAPNKFSNYPTPIKEQDESKYSNQKKKDTPGSNPTVEDSDDSDSDDDDDSSSDISSATGSKSTGGFMAGDKAAQMKYLLEKYTGKNKKPISDSSNIDSSSYSMTNTMSQNIGVSQSLQPNQ